MQPGIVFAMTIAKSYRSRFAGTQIAIGHGVVEVPLILLMYFGFARFLTNNVVQLTLSIVGGAIVIWLGIAMFRARDEVVQRGHDLPYPAFIAGILTTVLNPFFWVWWATVGSMLLMKFLGFGVSGLASLIVVHWLCDLLWLSLVSLLVYQTRSLWGIRFQEGLFIACSLLLVGFGGWYLVSGIQLVV